MGKGSPKGDDSSSSSFKRQIITKEIPPINVTPYPLSSSTEMAMAMSTEAKTLQERIAVLTDVLWKLQKTREASQPNMDDINDASNRIENDGRVTISNRNRLKKSYLEHQQNVGQEIQLAREALSLVYKIRAIRHDLRVQAKSSGNKETFRRGALMKMLLNCAQTLPLYLGDEAPPPLCGCVPPESNYIVPVGDMAACLVRGAEGEENWILAEINGYNPGTGRYEVEDIDEEQKERHTISRRRVYPLPLQRANPQTNPEALYAQSSNVMALYPQTTCFYMAYVSQSPQLACDDYEVLFEDPSYPDGYSPPLKIAQRYVLPYKEANKKK